MKKKYDIKTTDVETLKKYHLMTLGRALDEKAVLPAAILGLVIPCSLCGA